MISTLRSQHKTDSGIHTEPIQLFKDNGPLLLYDQNIDSIGIDRILTNNVVRNIFNKLMKINPFQANVPILYPLKTPENL